MAVSESIPLRDVETLLLQLQSWCVAVGADTTEVCKPEYVRVARSIMIDIVCVRQLIGAASC